MMKTVKLALILMAFVTLPLEARSKHQSYITYDDGGGTFVKQGDDGREIEARRNLPIYPGDEIRTDRRARTELRLADSNVLALDRESLLRFHSILDSYSGDDEQTVAELMYGEVMVRRLEREGTPLRLDTANASYVSSTRAIYGVESDGQGDDVVSVYEGTIEVRTPRGTSRARSGEKVRVDQRGIYSSVALARDGTTDFERWFLRRSQRYGRTSRYLDDSLSYAGDDLDEHGAWVYVNDYSSWVWRPRVSVGWRPYYYGSWGSRHGRLTWISDEPWGWVPYHYGRWAWASNYGWIWIPGGGYSPAWVYWVYGPSYVGWVPAGWYDCHRPYYDWLYRPYHNTGISFGLGFHGRVRLTDIDHRAWTFINPDTLVSKRIDRAALTTDAIRNRLSRDGNQAVFSNTPARFGRDELKDPAAAVRAIARRGIGSGTGKESSGSNTDVTSFFRRDPELSNTVRDRLVRSRDSDAPAAAANAGASRSPRGVVSRIGSPQRGSDSPTKPKESRGGAIPRLGSPDRGESPTVAPEAAKGSERGSISTRVGSPDRGAATGRVNRGESQPTPEREASSGERPEASPRNDRDIRSTPVLRDREWRDRGAEKPAAETKNEESATVPSRERSEPSEGEWRRRGVAAPQRGEEAPSGSRIDRDDSEEGRAPATERDHGRAPSESSSDDVPRRIIDRIGGARLTPSDRGESSTESSPPRAQRGTRERPAAADRAPRVERPSTSSGSGKTSSSSGSSKPPAKSSESGGGKIKRDRD